MDHTYFTVGTTKHHYEHKHNPRHTAQAFSVPIIILSINWSFYREYNSLNAIKKRIAYSTIRYKDINLSYNFHYFIITSDTETQQM